MTLQELKEYKLAVLLDIVKICQENKLQYFLMWGTLLGAVRHDGFIPWDDDIDIGLLWNDYNTLISILKTDRAKQYFIQNYETEENFPELWTQVRVNGTTSMPIRYAGMKMHWGMCIDIFPLISLSNNEAFYRKQIKAFRLAKALLIKEHMKVKGEKAKGAQWWLNKLPNRIRHMMVRKILKKYVYLSYDDDLVFCLGSVNMRKKFPLSAFQKIEKHGFEGYQLDIPEGWDTVLSRSYGDYMSLPPIEKRGGHELSQGETINDINKDYKQYQKELLLGCAH